MGELSTVLNDSDASVIANLADRAHARELLTLVADALDGIILTGDQRLERIDLEQFADAPFVKRGSVVLTDPTSFFTYVNRHSLERATTLWSDVDTGKVTAVLDDHVAHADKDTQGPAGWGRHRAVLALKQTPDWTHWLKRDGQYMDHDVFAEHIEDGVDAIRDPDAATMLEVAQTFHAKSGVNFKSTKRLGGEVEFAYEETVKATAGQKGKFEVPEILTLGLAPFDGNELYEVKARIRFRLRDGHLSIGYRLIRPDKVRRAAFDDVIAQVSVGTDFPVMAGTPRPTS